MASAVKWAIESATGIRCLHRDRDLLAEAAPSTANRLAGIAAHIALSFHELATKFSAVNGVSLADRGVFIMGLYDGMMNDLRMAGQPLPSRPGRKGRIKKLAVSPTASLHIHPYTLAFGLGRQIRLSVPLQQIAAELETVTQPRLPKEAATARCQANARAVE